MWRELSQSNDVRVWIYVPIYPGNHSVFITFISKVSSLDDKIKHHQR